MPSEKMSDFVRQNAIVQNFTRNSWCILNPIERSIKEKIEKIGVPLKDWDIKIYRGILTGCNEAFIIDGATKDALIAQDPKSAEIIRPILRGRDIKRYSYDFADKYIILASFGSHEYLEEKYPAIYNHLLTYKSKLEQRGQCRYMANGKPNPKGKYPGQHHWLELDNNPRQNYLDGLSIPLEQDKRQRIFPNNQQKADMIYGYVRVSTDKQTTDNQRFEIEKFCADKKYAVESWIEETISGTKRIEERRLGKLLRKMVKNDILVVTELSRLGRNLMQIMSILHFCMEKNIMVMTTKEHYELGNNINSQVLAFAFGLSAQIERNLISARTKEALARKKAEGVILGRPKGRKSIKVKLTGKENIIQMMLAKDLSKSKIARKLRVHRATLTKFIIERLS